MVALAHLRTARTMHAHRGTHRARPGWSRNLTRLIEFTGVCVRSSLMRLKGL